MTRHFQVAGLLVALALYPAAGRAAAPNLDNLLQNSPFGGPAAGAGGARADAPLEFRGVLVEGGENFFSIYESASRSSLWVGANEPGNPYKVQAYDSVKGVVTVDYKGTVLTLPLKQAKVLVLAPVSPAGPPQPNGPVGPGSPANVTSANPGGDPAKLVEEIRRRRALRQQAAQFNGPTPSPTPSANPAPALPVPNRN